MVLARAAGLALLLLPAAGAPARRGAPPPMIRVQRPPYRLGVQLSRGVVKLGEGVTYHGWITGGGRGTARFLPPDSGGAFTWGGPAMRESPSWGGKPRPDGAGRYWLPGYGTLFVDVPLQAFAYGELAVPGLRVEVDDGTGPRIGHLPTARLVVVPVMTAADSNARLRPLRGPLAAPWWERVPWTPVAIAAGLLAAVVTALVRLRRRKPAAKAAAPVTAVARRDPAAQALAELEALRRLKLPASARFAEHAFQLGRIVRRFLEATAGTPRPGDTTPEFVTHLEAARLSPEDVQRIRDLMRFWDRVKFARAPETPEEAVQAESAVENLVRRLAPKAPAAAAPVPGVKGKAA